MDFREKGLNLWESKAKKTELYKDNLIFWGKKKI